MAGPWMLSSQNGRDYGSHHGWALDVWSESVRESMDIIVVALSSQNGLDHGRHHGWSMDALFSERIRPWTSSWLGHGCSRLRAD